MSTIRPLFPRLARLSQQSRNARIVPARFYQSSIPSTILSKYQEKLNRKAAATGVKSFDELRQIYADRIAEVKKEAAVPEIDAVLNAASPAAEGTREHQPFVPPPAPAPLANSRVDSKAAEAARAVTGKAGVKGLDSYIDVAALSKHDAKDIGMIWRARFVNKGKSLCAVVPAETYARMAELGRKYPMFVLPLAREGQGVEMHLLQWTFPSENSATVLFTSLAEYKLRGEFATPHTTLTHHLELAKGKDVVLVQGGVMSDAVTVEEAQVLVVGLQKFYGALEDEGAERRKSFVEKFGKGDASFKIDDLIEEAQKIV